MPEAKPLVLTVDDDEDLAALIGHHVRQWGHDSDSVHSAEQLWNCLESAEPDVMLLDVMLGDTDGSQLVAEVKQLLPSVPVIMITRSASVEAAVRCMKHGAADYITKPLDFDRLRKAVGRALALKRVARQVSELGAAASRDGFQGIVGRSESMLRLYQLIESVAPTDVPVMILGETGTGKELVARAIHRNSSRETGPFVAVNAAAIPHELIESALFGHEKGAFTGAQRTHLGYCEQADGGTLFLDEIGEMDFDVQAKLLRFLQDHALQRVGGRATLKVDVRILAATNVDPIRQIAERRLREDLFYRLRVVSLKLPALRDRSGDLALLTAHFLARASQRHGKAFTTITSEALGAFERYAWPGNVRELENLIEEAVVLHQGTDLTFEMLPLELTGPADEGTLPTGPAQPVASGAPITLSPRELAERQQVVEALDRAAGHPEAAADELGISRATIYRRIKKYGLAGRFPA